MGSNDMKETARQCKTLKRKEADKQRKERQLKRHRDESKQEPQLIDDEMKDCATEEEQETEDEGPTGISEQVSNMCLYCTTVAFSCLITGHYRTSASCYVE